MPLPNPLATAFIVYKSDENGPFVIVNHYFQVGTFTVDQTACDQLAFSIDLTVGPVLLQCIPSDCNYVRTQVNINVAGVSFTGSNNSNNDPGSGGTQSLPDYCACVIQKKTDTPGRAGRGRWYIGCVPEDVNNTGVLSSAGALLYQDLGNALIQDNVTPSGTWRAGHLSRSEDICVPIRAIFVNDMFGTRRKRLVRPTI